LSALRTKVLRGVTNPRIVFLAQRRPGSLWEQGGFMEHERSEGDRTLMRIHIGESDRCHGKPLYEAVVELLQREKIAGATVLRGVAGFGGHYHYHTQKILRLAQELPIIIEVVDYTERIEKILPRLDEMIEGRLLHSKRHTSSSIAAKRKNRSSAEVDDARALRKSARVHYR
jgi:uncharacterized protein